MEKIFLKEIIFLKIEIDNKFPKYLINNKDKYLN